MKKILIVVVLAISTSAFAQDMETFIGEGKVVNTGYGALTTQYTRLNGKSAVFTGAYGGWMINHQLMIGLGGYGMVTNQDGFDANGEVDTSKDLMMGYGGLMLEYTIIGQKRLHVTTNLLIGRGGVASGEKKYEGGFDFNSENETFYNVLQPSVGVEANLTNWFRVEAGGGYRLIKGSNMPGLSDKKLSAPMMNVTLKFGKF